MATEYAHLTDGFLDSIQCVCGNTCSDDGMPYADENGIPMHLGKDAPPAGLAEMPEDGSNCFVLCPVCGRLYREADAEKDRIAVVKTIDLADPAVIEAFRVHDILMAGGQPD